MRIVWRVVTLPFWILGNLSRIAWGLIFIAIFFLLMRMSAG